jgi:hypothetical protein
MKPLGNAVRAVDVRLHHQIELLHRGVSEGTDRRDSGVVHQPVQAATRIRDRLDGGVDILRVRYVEAHRLNVLDSGKGLQICLLARAGIDEVAVGREPLGDLAPNAGTRTRDQNGFGPLWIRALCAKHRGCHDKEQQRNDATTHMSPRFVIDWRCPP